MAYQYTSSNPTTGIIALLQIKEFLKTAGWTVTRSGDGTSFSSSSDLITHGGTGAGGLNNTGSWFVLRQPGAVSGATREVMFQKTTNSNCFVTYYSYSAGFTTGGSATVASTASDQQLLVPSSNVCYFPTDGLYTLVQSADTTAPYGWWSASIPIGGGIPIVFFGLDPLLPGSYDAGDVDPYVWYFNTSANTSLNNTQAFSNSSFFDPSNTVAPRCWFGKGLSKELFSIVFGVSYSLNTTLLAPSGIAPNYITGKEELLPVMYARKATVLGGQVGLKGTSSTFKWVGASRSAGDTFTVNSTRDWMCLGFVAVPWDGSIPAL